MGDSNKKYPGYSSFKDPKAVALPSTSNDNSKPCEKASTESERLKRTGQKSDNLPRKNSHYTEKYDGQFHYQNNPSKHTMRQRSYERNSPHHYGQDQNFRSRNGSDRTPSTYRRGIQNSKDHAPNDSSNIPNEEDSKELRRTSPRKTSQRTSAMDLMKNMEDGIKYPSADSNGTADYLPKAPYALNWSTLFERNGFPQDIIQFIEAKEFQAYINQPSHKKGRGLFYGEFADLPPRFQKKAIESIISQSGKLQMPEHVVNNLRTSFEIMPDVSCSQQETCNGENHSMSDEQSSDIATSTAAHTVKIPPGFKRPDNSELESNDSRNAAEAPKSPVDQQTALQDSSCSCSTFEGTHTREQKKCIKKCNTVHSTNSHNVHELEKVSLLEKLFNTSNFKVTPGAQEELNVQKLETSYGHEQNLCSSKELKVPTDSRTLERLFTESEIKEPCGNQTPPSDAKQSTSELLKTAENKFKHSDSFNKDVSVVETLKKAGSADELTSTSFSPVSKLSTQFQKSRKAEEYQESRKPRQFHDSGKTRQFHNSGKTRQFQESRPHQFQESRPRQFQESSPHRFQESSPHQFQESRPRQFQESRLRQFQESRPRQFQESSPHQFQESRPRQFQESRPPHFQESRPPHFQKPKPPFSQRSSKPLTPQEPRKAPPYQETNLPPSSEPEKPPTITNGKSEIGEQKSQLHSEVDESSHHNVANEKVSNGGEQGKPPGFQVSNQLPLSPKKVVNNGEDQSAFLKKKRPAVRAAKGNDFKRSKVQKEKELPNQKPEFDCALQALPQIYEETSRNSKTCRRDTKCTEITVKVRDHVNDAEYWNTYLCSVLSHDNFKVQNTSAMENVLQLKFNDMRTAKNAHQMLVDLIKNDRHSPIINAFNSNEFNKKCANEVEIIKDCRNELTKLYTDYFDRHKTKIQNIRNRIQQLESELNKGNSLADEEKTLNINLQMLCDMKMVFHKYYEDTLDDPALTSTKFELKDIKKLKANFRYECNFLNGALPIYSKKDEIINMIDENQITVLVADTGSGKSTQLVQYLLQAGFGERGRIVCTQPRKIAAINLARYISGLLGSPVGGQVGYETGLTVKCGPSTKILYMTDYILLRKFANNKLSGISCVIVDEAHERSLHTDLLLGLLKRYLHQQNDFKAIITSATINPTVFIEYFQPKAALLNIPGRIYPVQVNWQFEDASIGWNYLGATVKKAYDVHTQSEEGGILAFLATPSETEEAIIMFRQFEVDKKRHGKVKTKLMTLHGKLDTQAQMEIFDPPENGYRKIIFATNSAETSITVPGIRYVIDSGMAKEKTYDVDRKRSMLVIGFVNRSSADQRKGRAGRTQPGICYRMYSKRNFENDMSESTLPEILRVDLQLAVLQILHLNIQLLKFDFISKPSETSIEEAMDSLENLGAVKNKRVTELGRKIVKFPLEPQFGKLILRGIEVGIGYECTIIAAMITVSGRIFFRPEDKQQEADRKKLQLCIDGGDFHTLLWVYWQWFRIEKQARDDWCYQRYINAKAMVMAEQLVNELCAIFTNELQLSIHKLRCLNMTEFTLKFERVIFDCFSENLCVFSGHEKSGYLSPYLEGSFFIHPSSAISYLGQKMPMFILYGGILKTSRPFLINVCPIKEKTIVQAHQEGKFSFQIDLLKQLQILPRVIRPVGYLVLSRYILGGHGDNIREIEETIHSLIGSNAFYLDVNVVKGEIVTYVEQQHQRTMNEAIMSFIKKAHVELAKEEIVKEELINDTSVPLTYSLTCGGEIKDILLPGEFKEISIECRTSFCNIPKLMSELERFEIVSYAETTSVGNKKILALFSKVSHAKKAVSFLKGNTDYIVSGKPHIAHVMERPIPLFVIKASWTRLPCKGTGWIELHNPNDSLTVCFQLTSNRLSIDNQYIVIEPTKNSKSIYMYHLPPLADENDIKEAIEKRLQDFNIKIKKVTLVRQEGFDVTDSEMNYIKKQLFKHFAPYTLAKNLIVQITYPQRNDIRWEATLNFTNLEDGEKAVDELKDNLKIDHYKVDLQATLKFSLYCRYIVFNVLRRDIEQLGKKYERNKKCTDFLIEPKNDALMSISFVCQKVVDLFEVRNDFVKLVEGYHIDCSEDKSLQALLSRNAEISLKEIESNFKTLIITDSTKKLIFVYGSTGSCTRTINEIKSLAKGFSRTQKKKIFNLCSDSMPSGFLKTLYNRYGFGLRSFIKQFRLRDAYMNILRHELILEGLPKRIAEAEIHLEEICAELAENNENEKRAKQTENMDVDVCPICYDEISTESIRLEHCGHSICKPCLKLQLQSEIFPVLCVKEECGEPFFTQDIRNITAGDDELKQQIAEAALRHFVSTNLHEVRYCPTPNCHMIYRVNTNDPEFKCPCCENDLCTACNCLYHHGMTCEMYQMSQKDSDYPLKLWLKDDTSNRKKCSTCNAAIEKDGGCNHVLCTNCKSHMCWLCLRKFETDEEVYAHIPYCENADK